MNNKDFKQRIAYEVLVILGVLALLLFICRLWPILLLVILGIFGAVIRLLFLSAKKVEVIPPLPQPPAREQTEREVRDLVFSTVQRRITELVSTEYPDARWVWKTSEAKANITTGKEVSILLNHAGGYRQATVVIHGLQVCGLAYQHAPDEPDTVDDTDIVDDVDTEEDTETANEADPVEESVAEESEPAEQQPQNYEYLAFEWVDAHVMNLNDRCNESIAQGYFVLELSQEELPAKESWPDICRELERNGMEDCECTDGGIIVHLKQ